MSKSNSFDALIVILPRRMTVTEVFGTLQAQVSCCYLMEEDEEK
jgi:hypothetical protein